MPTFDEAGALGPRRRHQVAQDRRTSAATAARALDKAPTWRDRWDDTQLLPVLIQVEVTPRQGAPWPPLLVAPRAAPEAGCRAWDTDPCVAQTCAAERATVRADVGAAAHRRDLRSARQRGIALASSCLAHHHADGHRERLRVLDAQRGAVGAQRAVARAGARGGGRRDRAHGVRVLAAAHGRVVAQRRAAAHVAGRRRRDRRLGASTSRRASTSTPRRSRCSRAARARRRGPTRRRRARIVDAIQDWRDPDEMQRPNGAEEADYRMAGLKQKPANAPFETVSEVSRVLGVTPAILRAHRRQPDRAFAPAGHQCRSWRRATCCSRCPTPRPSSVDAYLQQRADARASKLPVPPFPPAAGFVAGAVPVWRIRAAATAPDGVTFAREAVVRPSGDARRPLLTLSWQDGTTVAAPVAIAGTPAGERPKVEATMADRELTLPSYGARMPRPRAQASGSPVSGSGGRASSVALMPAAPRAALARRRMRRCSCSRAIARRCGAAPMEEGRPVMQRRATIPLAGDARGRRPCRARLAARARRAGAPRVVISLPSRDCCARRSCCPRRSRRTSAGARLRSRPPYAVQARGALLRRGRRSSAIPRAAPLRRPRRGAPRGIVDPALKAHRGVGCGGGRGRARAARARRVNRASICCRPKLRRGATAVASLAVWLPLVLIARSRLPPPRFRLAEARIRASSCDGRPTRRARGRRSPKPARANSTPAWRTTTSRSSASTRFPALAWSTR